MLATCVLLLACESSVDALDEQELTTGEDEALTSEDEASADGHEPDDDGEIDISDDLVVEIDPALGIGCATASIANANNGASIAMSPQQWCSIDEDGSISPNSSYNPVGCSHEYITEVTGTLGRPLGFYMGWHGDALNNEASCEAARMTLSAFGWNGVSWVALGSTKVHGVWNSMFLNYCSWSYDAGYGLLPSLGVHGYSKIRTSAQATKGSLFTKQRVESGVSHGNGPC